MSGQDLQLSIAAMMDDLDKSVKALRPCGEKYAQAERKYRVALAQKELTLRASGQAVTLVPDLARGDETVATLKMERDIAEALLDAARDSINSLKLRIKIVGEQIEREWRG